MESMSTARSNQILALLATAALMGVLDFSIVNVALPSIQHPFHLAPDEADLLVRQLMQFTALDRSIPDGERFSQESILLLLFRNQYISDTRLVF